MVVNIKTSYPAFIPRDDCMFNDIIQKVATPKHTSNILITDN